MLVRLGRIAERIDKVQKSAVFLVPACLDRPVEYLLRLADKLRIACSPCVLKQEPYALYIVAGVDNASLGEVKPCLAVRADRLKHTLELRVDVIPENILHAACGTLLVKRLMLGVDLHQNACDVQIDHRDAEGSARARLRLGLRSEAGGILHAVCEIPIDIISSSRSFKAGFIARYAVILGIGHRVEGLGEVVSSLAEGFTVSRDGEVHSAVRIGVDAVLLHKVKACLGCLEPLGSYTVITAQPCVHPAAASLHPDALIC